MFAQSGAFPEMKTVPRLTGSTSPRSRFCEDGPLAGVCRWDHPASKQAPPQCAAHSLVRAILCLVLVFGSVSGRAQTAVNGCSQQALLNAITNGGNVIFTSNCTITVTTPISIGAGTTRIDAHGFAVSISGGNSAQLFNVSGTLQLVGLSLLNGKSPNGGALYINSGGTVTASNCTFGGNAAVGSAGSAGADGADKAYGFGNSGQMGSPGAPGLGGAIYNLGSLTLINSTLATNSATGGNGGNGGNGGSVGGTIGQGGDGGSGAFGAVGYGGAIYSVGELHLINCTLSGNSVTGGNGGTGGSGGDSRNVSTNGSGIFPGLSGSGGAGGSGFGGAVYNGMTASILGCTFSGNAAQGGASATGGNQANGVGTQGAKGGDASGAGLCNVMQAVLTNSTFYSNAVSGGTGGTGGDGTGSLSTGGDGGNGGNGNGGSVYNAGSMAVVNCTLSTGGATGGTNGVAGSGRFGGSAGSMGDSHGGNLASLSGTVVLLNTILANNTSGGNGYGSVTDAGHNLSSDASIPLGAAGSKVNVPVKLGALANNGGPTLTMALLAGSPAIDAIGTGSPFPATDQRGVQRPLGNGADIGAYEFGTASALIILPPTLSSNRVNITFASDSGRAYVIQFKNRISDAVWTSLVTNTGTGTWLTNQDLMTNQPGRFYRVLTQ